MTPPRPDVFLSYSREDQATARRYAEALQREGFQVWWDQALSTGEAYDTVTEQALDDARAVVVLWSKTSVTSRWVRAEATTADRNGVLMPVMIEECRRPVMFELMQTAEHTHWKGDTNDSSWRAFVADLKRLVLRGQSPEAAALLERSAKQEGAVPASSRPPAAAMRASSGSPVWKIIAATVVAGLLVAGFLGWQRMNRVKQARAQVPEIAKLVDAGNFQAAFTRAQEVRRYVPDDPLLASLTPLFTAEYSITSTPEGADVFARGYDAAKDPWIHVGRTPLEHVTMPRRAMLWRFEKEGFVTAERANTALGNQNAIAGYLAPEAGKLEVKLWTPQQQPPDMVYVPGGQGAGVSYTGLPQLSVPPFFIDRNEVTNAQFKEFVDAGGYERRQYWEGLDIRDAGGKFLSFEEAMKRFIDSTGRPGPSKWELGNYPQGRDQYPVTGVSWYEASAYARFRNRSLPSVSHWTHAAMQVDEIGSSLAASIAPLSNFGTSGPAPVGQGVGLHGTHDLYGNVREWLSNPGPGGGWVIGGGWEDPTYSYADAMPVPRIERSPLNGFRLMKPSPDSADNATLHAAFTGKEGRTDIATAKPISDALYATYSRHFAYRPGPLNATAPVTMATTDDWIKQRVTIDTGYEDKRMDVILFIPRRGQPPFQSIILFSGMQMFLFPATRESIEPGFASMPLDFILRSGRVLVQPIFEGTFERFKAPIDFNDEILLTREYAAWRWDLGRTIDYLESRSDVDARHIGYIGLSFGSSAALPVVATEPRLKAAVLVSGGIPPQVFPPMVDPLNYAPHLKIPVLMINGRFDAGFTVEGHQKPLFRLLGTPPADKRHLILEYGHGSPPRGDLLRESLAWYDKYLGEVRQ